MPRLVGLAGLMMLIVGFIQAGFWGALTGLFTTGLIGLSLGILMGDPEAKLAPIRSALGIGQRTIALVAGGLGTTGVVYGGWRWGWAWSLVGFILGLATILALPSSLARRLAPMDDVSVAAVINTFLTDDELCRPLFTASGDRKTAEPLIRNRVLAIFKRNTTREGIRDVIRSESLKWKSILDAERVAAEGSSYMAEAIRRAPFQSRVDFCVTRIAGWLFESEYREPFKDW